MYKISEISKISGVSIRTLQYYDEIGLLKPAKVTERGYRMYDDTNLSKLGEILLLRELEFSLKQITEILTYPGYDRKSAIDSQIELLTMKKERLEKLIEFAEKVKKGEAKKMDFKAFDNKEYEILQAEAKERWGKTDAYKEFEDRSKNKTKDSFMRSGAEMMKIFAELGDIKDKAPDGREAQLLVGKLQDFITVNYYTCTKEILASLGIMYTADKRFTASIDNAGGAGTAEFAGKAIEYYCK